jgi:hypothetical protein
VRESEDHMEVRSGQEPFHTVLEPLCLFEALAFGAMPIAAGVIEDAGVSALILTQLEMPP